MPNLKINQVKTNGRPLSYDPHLVHKIVAEGLAAGLRADELDARRVRQTLCDEYGVKPTIRLEAIESLVVAAHAEIREAETQGLIAALPDGTVSAVQDAVTTTGKALLLLVARQHAAALIDADATCEVLRSDKRNAQHRIAQLEGELAEEKEANGRVAGERNRLAQQLSELQDELRGTQAELVRLRQESNSLDRLLMGLRDPAVLGELKAVLFSAANTEETPAAVALPLNAHPSETEAGG